MNSRCPYCGGKLRATVEQRYDNVPLYDDGYIPAEGDHVYSEVSNVRCSECGRELSSDYYHSGECRLKSAVRAATAEEEEENCD